MMLRLAALLVFIFASIQQAGANPTLVIDVETGEVLHADRAGAPWYPASLTKLMTAYVTFERLRDDPDFTLETPLKVSPLATREPPSKMGVGAGASVSVGRALNAMIIYSANDIAVVLAEGVGGSVPAFVDKMNAAAARLGMTATKFRNPNGLPDDEQVTTARDLAILARALVFDFPEYAGVFADPVLEWGKRRLNARNSLLRTFEGADGMKTGFICASGYNVVATATRAGRRLLVVVLGAATGNIRMQIAANLLETAFASGAPILDYGSVETISNDASGLVAPPNLRAPICDKSNDRPLVVKAASLDGWGTLIGTFGERKTANAALNRTVAALRGVVAKGKAAVVDADGPRKYSAVIAGFSVDQAFEVCEHLHKAGEACELLPPGEVLSPPAM